MNEAEFFYNRAYGIINRMISKLQIDLTGYTVLTEIGSNYYLYVPIIAKIAGAKKVIAWAKDSSYGYASDIKENCLQLARRFGIDDNLFIRENEFNINDVKEADIITNSGVLRPLDEKILKYVKKTCVVPLMYEAWELRATDIDIDYCRKRGIKVAGTWENHPDLNVFDYGRSLAVKLALEAGFEVFNNNILVWSDDHFGEVSEQAFLKFGASKVIRTTDINVLKLHAPKLDFIYVCDYSESRNYLGDYGLFSEIKLSKLNSKIALIHLYGNISIEDADNERIFIYPRVNGISNMMTKTLGYVGLEPILRLQAAGLKVAQELLQSNYSKLSQLISV